MTENVVVYGPVVFVLDQFWWLDAECKPVAYNYWRRRPRNAGGRTYGGPKLWH